MGNGYGVAKLMSSRSMKQLSGGELSHRAGLMKELIAWGQSNPTKVISLEDLTTTIFASRSAIVHSCRSTFGLGPMALLKQIRPMQADVTPNDEIDQALMREYGIIGPPAILFFDRRGEEMPAYRLVGYFTPAEFTAHLQQVIAAQ